MANNSAKNELATVEELTKQSTAPAWKIAGTRAANRWENGKMLTKKEFDKAVEDFGKGTMTGGKANG